MTIISYRLHTNTGPISVGPLALVVPQAVTLARTGTPATITGPKGRSYRITQHPDRLALEELDPAELFPQFDTAAPAPWAERARTLSPDLQEHTQ